MTFAQWYQAIKSLDHKSPQAQSLINQYPQHYAKMRAIIRKHIPKFS